MKEKARAGIPFCIHIIPHFFELNGLMQCSIYATTKSRFEDYKKENPKDEAARGSFILKSPEFTESVVTTPHLHSELRENKSAFIGIVNVNFHNKQFWLTFPNQIPIHFGSRGLATLMVIGILKYAKNFKKGEFKKYRDSFGRTVEQVYDQYRKRAIEARKTFRAKQKFTTQNIPKIFKRRRK